MFSSIASSFLTSRHRLLIAGITFSFIGVAFYLVIPSQLFLRSSSVSKPHRSIIMEREKKITSRTSSPRSSFTSDTPSSPKYPSPKDRLSDEELTSFPEGSVIESADIEDATLEQSVRVRILKTNFKYPYLRTEELFDSSTGIMISREVMVADHLLVTLPSEEESTAFLESCGPEAIRLERVTSTVPLYRLILKTASLSSLPEVLLKTNQEGKSIISEPDFLREAFLSPSPLPPNDLYYSLQWELSPNTKNTKLLFPEGINAPAAWKIRTSAASVIVAIIDTGIYYNHEDLSPNMWHNPNPTCNDLYGCNTTFLSKENELYSGDPMDPLTSNSFQGHGTACAGIIGAAGNNGLGITGIAWEIQLMACKFFDSSGRGTDSDAVTCTDYACAHGAKILNCSWGHRGAYSETLFQAFERAQSQGVIIVTAAGNDHSNNDTIMEYPANYQLDNIVVVASSNENDELAHSSNYGPHSVHLAAPGVSIYSTSVIANPLFGHPYYTYMSGTSVAAPHVTGALALMIAEFPSLSYQEIIAKLLAATDPIPALQGKTIAGRLNIAKALESR